MIKLLMVGAVVFLMFSPLYMAQTNASSAETEGKDGENKEVFAGADTQAKEMITEINPEYRPWFTSIWTPPSGEIESLLFALQAALGAGILFYYLGYVRGRKDAIAKMESNNASH